MSFFDGEPRFARKIAQRRSRALGTRINLPLAELIEKRLRTREFWSTTATGIVQSHLINLGTKILSRRLFL